MIEVLILAGLTLMCAHVLALLLSEAAPWPLLLIHSLMTGSMITLTLTAIDVEIRNREGNK